MGSGERRLRVEVLGPLRVWDADGRDATPPGALQRRLLALLVLRRGEVVAADAAIEALWPGGLPVDPAAALQNHLFRLRRGLPEGTVSSMGTGYRLEPAGIDVDVDRLGAVVGRGADDAAAWDELVAVLDRWHGPAFPELQDIDEGRAAAARLEELRIRAREVLAEERLRRGEHDALVAELVELTDQHPLRERPRALLMSALAGAGRTVEALRAFDDFRRLLGDELGIEPSPGLAAEHADLLAGTEVAPTKAPRRLPVPPTTLVGRDALLVEIDALADANRAVTLVGPGGVGKTRLLIELGHRLGAARPDRPVVLCELAQADRGTALDAVASTLGIDARPGVGPIGRITDVLGSTALVLLLDNCEHVLDPVAELVERLLAACPNVGVVATSRERLRVAGEQVCPVPTLLTGTGDASAVELFIQRARAAAPGFAPGADSLADVAEIVRRLDGLPLAIELAAARLHTHDLEEVAAGIDQRFTLLSTGYRSSSRHASLAAAVSWSFGLLEQQLQHDFVALSVFSGPFAVADAAAVFDVGAADAADSLGRLVERSLVMRAPGRRFVLLETLRAFGAEELAASGAADVVAERHARRLIDRVEVAYRELVVPGRPVLAEIDEAVPELRAALAWLLDHGRVDLAGHLVTPLLNYGLLRLRPDVLVWAEPITAADPDDRSPVAARVWAMSAYAAWMAGDVAESGARSTRALAVAGRAGGPVPPDVFMTRANFELFEGRLVDAAAWYRRALDASVGDPTECLVAAATMLLALGYAGDPAVVDLAAALAGEVGDSETALAAYVWYCAGEADMSFDLERARARLVRAVEIAEATNASFVRGVAGASKASIDARMGDPAAAAADFRWLIAHWRRAGMWSTQWTMLRSIAGLLARVGRDRDAAVLEGAVRGSAAGHRIFGADELALADLGAHLAEVLGDADYAAARAEGSRLDGDAAAEHALRALRAL